MRYYIKGLDCPHCAANLEKYIQQNKHVKYAKIDFTKGLLDLKLDNEENFDEVYKDILTMEKVEITKKEMKYNFNYMEIIKMILSLIFLILGIVFDNIYLYIAAYLIVGLEVLYKAIKNIFKGNVFDERFLMSIASIGAFAIKEYHEAVMVMLLYTLGEFLQELAVNKSREKIKNLVDFKVDSCNVIVNGEVINKDVNDVNVNDIIEVRLGEKVPLDGILLSDHGTFNTQSLTGESKYYDLNKDDEVISGYVNEGDVIQVKVTKLYNDSTIKKIMDMIENATDNKAKTENFITKFAKYYTPIVCLLAVCIFIISYLLGTPLNESLNSALIFLVVSCPCALILSIPLLYFAAIGKCSKEGILVKGSSYLEAINDVKEIIFDKTGTLTDGEFSVIDYSDEETLNIAANLEKYSIHPLAKSITKKLISNEEVKDFKEEKGLGVSGTICNSKYYFGNKKFIKSIGVEVPDNEQTLYLVKDNQYMGYVSLKDMMKEGTKEVIDSLKDYNLVLLSGDEESRVKEVANELNIKEYYYGKLPHEKSEIVKQKSNTMYVGDGVNDSISLINANIGVSMGIKGADSSVEVSNVVLAKDDIKSLPVLFSIAKKTKNIAMFNIIFILLFKLLFLVLGGFNLIDMSVAVFADVGVALISVISSLRILK